jgi:PAS domain S-box-containing protein
MTPVTSRPGRRILIVDDDPAIHDCFREIFRPDRSEGRECARSGAELLSGNGAGPAGPEFQLDFACQGEEALRMVRQALDERHPYLMAFIDMRLPPGWDGIETTARIWEADRHVQVVLCSAYADYTWKQVGARLHRPDQFAMLKKPFDIMEVLPLANAFTEKWQRMRAEEMLRQAQTDLEKRVSDRTVELGETRARLEHLLSSGPAIIYSVKLDTPERIAFVSGNVSRMLGFEPVELTGHPGFWNEHLHPEDAVQMPQHQTRLLADGQYSVEYRFQLNDGSYRWIHDDARVVRDARGKPVEIVGSWIDITERRRAEGALRLQTSALKAAANGIVITNRAGLILWVNPAFSRLTGYSPAEAIGKTSAVLKSGAHDKTFYDTMWQTILAGKVWQGEIVNRRKNGRLYHEEMTITPVLDEQGQIQNFVAVKQDISQRKHFEQALGREHDLLRTLLDNSPDRIYFKDLQSRFVRVSKSKALRTLQHAAPGLRERLERMRRGDNGQAPVLDIDLLQGLSDFDLYAEEHAQKTLEDEQHIIRTGEPIIGKMEKQVDRDGSIIWSLTNKLPWRDKEGKIIGTFGLSRDVTTFKEHEASPGSGEELFQKSVSPEGG